MIRRSTDTETARLEMDMIREEAEKKGYTGHNWLRAIKALLTAGGGIVKVLGYKGDNAEITAFHPQGHNMGTVLVPVMALRMASRRANTFGPANYHTIQMVQPWTDAYGTPAQDLSKEYSGADGEQMQPLRRRPDYGEREMSIQDRVLAMKDNEHVSRADVAQLCASCADKMERNNIRSVRASVVKDVIVKHEMRAALVAVRRG